MPDAPKKRGPKPKPSRTDAPVSIRAQADWKEWLTEYAASQRSTIPAVIDRALAFQAKQDGFKPPPPRTA